jgi:PTS system mannose-specific IIA component
MAGIIIATHYTFAESLKDTVFMIVGQKEKVTALTLLKSDTLESFTAKLKDAVEKNDDGKGVVIMADMFGGTPMNAAFALYSGDEKVKIITGVNMPMVVEAINHIDKSSAEITEMIFAKKDRLIIDVKSMIGKR